MSDEELCRAFGTTLAEVEADVEEFERGDWSGMRFGEPVDGGPGNALRLATLEFFDYELAAIDSAAEREGITRSAFVRRACGKELAAIA